MKLYGTTTSPYVRRVRVVAEEIGEPVDRIETSTDAGQIALREVSPIRKVPVAVVDGRTLYDSRVIIEWLTTTRGWGGLVPARDRWREANLVNAVDSGAPSGVQAVAPAARRRARTSVVEALVWYQATTTSEPSHRTVGSAASPVVSRSPAAFAPGSAVHAAPAQS